MHLSSSRSLCPPSLVRALLASCGLLLFAMVLKAQDPISIDQLRRGFQTTYNKEVVSVRGWVATEKRVASTTFKGFYLKDRFGSLILVRTTNPLPEITSELLVTGVATQDADTGDVYLTEVRRAAVGKDAEDAARRQEQAKQIAAAEQRASQEAAQRQADQQRYTLILIGIGTAVLILVVGAVILMRRQRAQSVPMSASSATPQPAGEPDSSAVRMDDFKTVKVYKTTKVLPAELVVLDNGHEGDVLHLSDQSGRGEIEIGRDSPDVSGGIRIKDPSNTVSRRQARLIYLADRGQFQLLNLAGDGSNPTTINGRAMRENESATLGDGDEILMGSLAVRFRAK